MHQLNAAQFAHESGARTGIGFSLSANPAKNADETLLNPFSSNGKKYDTDD